MPTFLLLGFAGLATGIGLLYTSSQVQQLVIDYTYCHPPAFQKVTCAQRLGDDINNHCVCWYKIQLTQDYSSSVFVYYALNNYFQSHRLYENSVDEMQLMGQTQASNDCIPFQTKQVDGQTKSIVPCGTIANSFFNDTYILWYLETISNTYIKVPLLYTSISWPVDKYIYKNPEGKFISITIFSFFHFFNIKNIHIKTFK